MNHSCLSRLSRRLRLVARRLSRTEYHRTFELVGTAHLKYYQKTISSLLLSEEIEVLLTIHLVCFQSLIAYGVLFLRK